MKRTFASLRMHRNYRLFFAGQVVSVSGTWMQNVAQAWLVWELTHSPVAVGVLGLCRFLPFTIFGLFGGVIADRLDYRRTFMATQASAMTLSAVLAVLALTGSASVLLVDLIAFLNGTVLVLDAPTRQSLTFQMVGRDELPNAVALNSSIFNASRIAGPGIAGLVIAGVGVGWCFAFNAVSFLAVLAATWLMRPGELIPLERGERPGVLAGIREGLAFTRRAPRIRLVLLMLVVLATLCFNFNVLLAVLASQTLHAGPRTFGVLTASFGLGSLIGALITAASGRASWRAMVLGAAGFGTFVLLLAPAHSVVLCALLLAAAGVCFTLYTANSNSTVQLNVPDRLRGRVMGIYYYAWSGTGPLGNLFAGWLAARGGTTLAFSVAGTAALVMAAVGALFGTTRGRERLADVRTLRSPAARRAA